MLKITNYFCNIEILMLGFLQYCLFSWKNPQFLKQTVRADFPVNFYRTLVRLAKKNADVRRQALESCAYKIGRMHLLRNMTSDVLFKNVSVSRPRIARSESQGFDFNYQKRPQSMFLSNIVMKCIDVCGGKTRFHKVCF